jgi:hypothetical protein
MESEREIEGEVNKMETYNSIEAAGMETFLTAMKDQITKDIFPNDHKINKNIKRKSKRHNKLNSIDRLSRQALPGGSGMDPKFGGRTNSSQN